MTQTSQGQVFCFNASLKLVITTTCGLYWLNMNHTCEKSKLAFLEMINMTCPFYNTKREAPSSSIIRHGKKTSKIEMRIPQYLNIAIEFMWAEEINYFVGSICNSASTCSVHVVRWSWLRHSIFAVWKWLKKDENGWKREEVSSVKKRKGEREKISTERNFPLAPSPHNWSPCVWCWFALDTLKRWWSQKMLPGEVMTTDK